MEKKAVKSNAKSSKRNGAAMGIKEDYIISGTHKPSEEEVRELAEILYRQRIDRGEAGTAENDWLQAEEFLTYPA
jgi:hypothetical protein